jgi:hypothetical protein
MDLVVVGGSDAGVAAALRARQIDPTAEIDVVVGDAYPNVSICGLPYLLSGEVKGWTGSPTSTCPTLRPLGVRGTASSRQLRPGYGFCEHKTTYSVTFYSQNSQRLVGAGPVCRRPLPLGHRISSTSRSTNPGTTWRR